MAPRRRGRHPGESDEKGQVREARAPLSRWRTHLLPTIPASHLSTTTRRAADHCAAGQVAEKKTRARSTWREPEPDRTAAGQRAGAGRWPGGAEAAAGTIPLGFRCLARRVPYEAIQGGAHDGEGLRTKAEAASALAPMRRPMSCVRPRHIDGLALGLAPVRNAGGHVLPGGGGRQGRAIGPSAPASSGREAGARGSGRRRRRRGMECVGEVAGRARCSLRGGLGTMRRGRWRTLLRSLRSPAKDRPGNVCLHPRGRSFLLVTSLSWLFE